MTASDVVQGRVYNISVEGTELTLVTDESFSFDAGEDMSSFDLATATTTQSIPGNADPQISFDLHVEKASQSGLNALGVLGDNGGLQFNKTSRTADTVTVEVLDGESGSVELTHEFNKVVFEFGGLDDGTPVEASATGYVNGDITLATSMSNA